MEQRPHILVVDDDNRLRRLLKKYLSENGFYVSEAADTAQARTVMSVFDFSLLVMDVMMPKQNGQDFTRELRAAGCQTPVLMLTAMGDIDNRIIGLEAGADDYLAKPFEPKELLLRIHNILKRHNPVQAATEVSFGACRYHMKTNQLLKNGEAVVLTGVEQDLLKFLIQKAGIAVSREDLAAVLQTDNVRTVDVQITRLRKKIETDIKTPVCIQTVRGQGYMLVVS